MNPERQHQPAGSHYRYLKRLARGGMAEVYLGESIAAGGVTRRVVLKRILPVHADETNFVDMFLTEARLASHLQHPNIIQTYDVLQSGGDYVMVLELLEGADMQRFLTQAARGGHALTLGHALYMISRVLAALNYAHERTGPSGRPLGIVHRDVSPHNIFLTYDGGVKLLDFGIAKAASRGMGQTQSNVLKGKVLYMSPEQCQGADVDRRTDIFATAVVLYRLLTGRHPHIGSNPYDTMRSIVKEEPRPVHVLNPDLGRRISDVVQRGLRKDPAERYQTARDMQLDLLQVMRSDRLFINDLEFGEIVGRVLGPPAAHGDSEALVAGASSLPGDIMAGEGQLEAVPPATTTVVRDGLLYQSECATAERIGGVTVLRLQGYLNETLDPEEVAQHLVGDVIVDSLQVERITSFGIRSLLAMFRQAADHSGSVYHTRCAVAFIQQVTMIRGVLGGGRILSFHVPFVDPVTGHEFAVRLHGEEGLRVLRTQQPPDQQCPADESRFAEFDEDPAAYLSFHEDYLVDPPEHIAAVVRSLEDEAHRRQVEKTVDDAGTRLWIRRPLTADFRWSRLLRGLEGQVTLELGDCPQWDEAGVDALCEALARATEDVRKVHLVRAPLRLVTAARQHPELAARLDAVTVRVPTTCQSCGAPRQVDMSEDALARGYDSDTGMEDRCPRCGGTLSLPVRPETPAPPPIAAPRTRGRSVGVALVVVLLCSLPVGAAVVAISIAAAWTWWTG